jgi:type II secretory pathway component PulF
MAIFKYRGKNVAGNIVSGERVGRSPQEIIAALEKDQIQVLNIEKKRWILPFLS